MLTKICSSRNSLSCNLIVAQAIKEALDLKLKPDESAEFIYDKIWTEEQIKIRNFAVFGGEFFMTQNVEGALFISHRPTYQQIHSNIAPPNRQA